MADVNGPAWDMSTPERTRLWRCEEGLWRRTLFSCEADRPVLLRLILCLLVTALVRLSTGIEVRQIESRLTSLSWEVADEASRLTMEDSCCWLRLQYLM